ncbi:MAG: hypothetical protein JNM45_07955 [Rhizobiales bacterium]|nr:hypothetical protein [Hyphomicrobiales bacterium]
MINGKIGKAEVAKALGKSTSEFEAVRSALHGLGFPQLQDDPEEGWAISDLLDWVMVQQEANLHFVEFLSSLEGSEED